MQSIVGGLLQTRQEILGRVGGGLKLAMARRSERNTYLLPKKDVERIHCEKLLRAIFGQENFNFVQPNPPAPDCLAYVGSQKIAIELTQPELVTKSQAVLRRWEEIAFESAERARSHGRSDCRVNLYLPDDGGQLFLQRSFDSTEFVAAFCDFLTIIQNSINRSAKQLSVHVNGDRIYVDHIDGCLDLTRPQINTTLPNTFQFDAFSDDGNFAFPIVDMPGTGWGYDEESLNRQRILDAIAKKVNRFRRYKDQSECDSVWMLVHYPSYGAPSFNAGNPRFWNFSRELGRIRGFDRIFFLELVSDFYELDFSNGEIRVIKPEL